MRTYGVSKRHQNQKQTLKVMIQPFRLGQQASATAAHQCQVSRESQIKEGMQVSTMGQS